MLSEIEMRPHPGPIESDRASRSGRRGVVDRRRSILVGHDFSGPAHRALARAVDVARTHEAKLHILHATPRVTHTVDRLFGNNRAVTHARDSLARVTAEVRAKGLSVRPHMIVGSVPQAVRSTAGELHASSSAHAGGSSRMPSWARRPSESPPQRSVLCSWSAEQ